MVTLVRSRFRDSRPALTLLAGLEDSCLKQGHWQSRRGPILFSPVKISARLYAGLSLALRPLLAHLRRDGAVLSVGLPYLHYLLGKTFPFFALGYDLRVLWTYDVWEPEYDAFCELVRQAQINILLVSSFQAAEWLRTRLPQCEVHWFPEFINAEDYPSTPWNERSIDVLSFGRALPRYHEAIQRGCVQRGINYVFDRDFPTWDALAAALADSKLCVCFPRATTNPKSAGSVSTLTFRYLQAMAAGCLPIGQAPYDAIKIFNHPAIIEVDWNDPVGQIKSVLARSEEYMPIREKNFSAVNGPLHVRGFVNKINELVGRRPR